MIKVCERRATDKTERWRKMKTRKKTKMKREIVVVGGSDKAVEGKKQ